jgi:acyl-CoA reductase-like NAD-dependent aldehyde dehydrogenase
VSAPSPAPLDGHRTAERRSLAMHALVAERLDDATVARALERVERWRATPGARDPAVLLRWEQLLRGPRAELAATLTADTPEAGDLRQHTPFAGVVAPSERWRIIREVR